MRAALEAAQREAAEAAAAAREASGGATGGGGGARSLLVAREKAQAEAARERQRADELERRLAASAESKEAATLEYAKNICIQMFLMGAADEGLQQLLPVAAACFGFSAAELQRVRDASAAAAAEASGGILGLLTPAKARPVDLPALTPRPTDADAARRIDRLKALLIASQAHIEQFQRRDASRGRRSPS